MAPLIFCGVGGAAPITLSFFGALPGQSGSRAYAVSADGYIVAGSASTPTGEVATRWTPSHGLLSLGVLPGDYTSEARVVGNGGQIAGRSNGPGGSRAFLWTPEAGMSAFGGDPVADSPFQIARDSDTVVGGSLSSLPDAVRWVSGATGVPLSGPFSGFDSGSRTAFSCSADGAVVVGQADTSTGYHAFRWTQAAGYRDLGTLAGGSLSTAWDVTPDGQVVVGGSTDSTGALRAFRWSAAGGMVQIAMPSNILGAVAYSTSADGSTIVGTCWVSSSSTNAPVQNAFLWRQSAGFAVLGTYLQGLVPQNNFWLMDARSVSDDGQVIVGSGTYSASGLAHYEGYMVRLAGAPPLCPADVGVQGGQVGSDGLLDNNDFVAFINLFFLNDPRADVGRQGGMPGADGQWNNNDFIAYIDRFFGGCP